MSRVWAWTALAFTLSAQAAPPPATPPAEKPTPVRTFLVQGGESESSLTAVGTLLADEEVMLRPEIVGRVLTLAFKEGGAVSKGQTLVRLDDAEYQARIRQVEAELKLLEERLRRAESLLAQQFISEQAVIDARQNVIQARARLDEAQVAQAKTLLRAPFNGVAGLRLVSPGAYVKEGQDIVGLSKIDRLKLDLRVPEIHLSRLRTVRAMHVSVDAWPGLTFQAQLHAIDPQVDPASRSLRVRALVANPAGQLKPGMFARIRLTLPAEAGVRIPEEAILAKPGKFLVYRVEGDRARPIKVKPGAREAGWVFIPNGLQAGDLIVTEGHQKLKPDSLVQPLKQAK